MTLNIDLNKIENQLNIMEHTVDGLVERVVKLEKKLKDREAIAKNAAVAFSERLRKSKASITHEVS
jgi:hypothetical protein